MPADQHVHLATDSRSERNARTVTARCGASSTTRGPWPADMTAWHGRTTCPACIAVRPQDETPHPR